MHNAMMKIMRTDALHDLYAGYVTPLDREILADMPLPSDMVDPFASEVADPLTTMNLTYVSLSGWIAEAKKEKYYSERFASLSKLVMKGVVTMARGLATLHKRGEELTAAPMQIDDLISVGSYHLRKSYLGVVQFSARHPEIGERLLVNQLGWSNTLLRLYKTRDKLASGVRSQVSGVSSNEEGKTLQNEEGSVQNEEMLNGNSDNSSFLLQNSSLDNVSALPGFDEGKSSGVGAFSSIDSIFAPAAYSAPRAFASLDKTGKTRSADSKAGRRELTAKTSSETKRETKRSEKEETIHQSAAPETELSPKKDGPLPMSEEAVPLNDPPEETKTSAVSEKTVSQYDPAEEAEPLPIIKETIPQNNPEKETGPSPMSRETITQSDLPENYGIIPQTGEPERKLAREGPSPPF